MELKVITEKTFKPISGFIMLLLLPVGLVVSTIAFGYGIYFADRAAYQPAPYETYAGIAVILSILGWLVCGFCFAGFKVVQPNEARVFTLFGRYKGTVKDAGFYFVNPFSTSFSPKRMALAKTKSSQSATGEQAATATTGEARPKAVSLKIQTLDNGLQKVNDVLGNPIIIGAVVIWRVDKPTQAVFSVENYYEYLSIQTDSTIRNTARLYPYDVFDENEGDDGVHEKTLRGSSLEIAETMKTELSKRVSDAGLVIEEVRITHLAYSEEIAAAMLQRQQAVAIIAARKKIVDGAVGMVQDAIDKLSERDIVVLDDERKAAMVSNLLVVLVGNHDAQPIVNTGSIY